MKKDKILVYTAIQVVSMLLFGMWVSTQWVASMLQYDTHLGQPMTSMFGVPIYAPKFLYWWYWFGTYAPAQFDKAALAMLLATIAAVGVAIFASIQRSKRTEAPTSHGTAKWAEDEDLQNTGLLDNKGIVLGKTSDGRYLRHGGPEHVMMMAPTRSGKGVCVIIPTLFAWQGSVICIDIKGENWAITSGYRKQKMNNKTLKMDLTAIDGSSVRFNPLSEIRVRTKNEVRDVQNQSLLIVDPLGVGILNCDHWVKAAYSLLTGVMMHLLYTRQNPSLLSVSAFLANPAQQFEDTLQQMLSTEHDETGIFRELYHVDSSTHPIVAQSARELLDKAEKERAGVLSTAVTLLTLYRDPIVAHNTAASEFSIDDLMNNDQPVSLYVVVPPSDIERLQPLLRMLLNLYIRRLIEKMDFADGKPVQHFKHKLLLLFDEFPALGRIDPLETSLAYIAGYGIKALLIIQELKQLYKTYTENNSIIGNCHIRIAYAPNDDKTPEFLAKLLGTKTEIVETQGFAGHRLNLWLGNMNTSQQEIARDLLTPGEISQLPDDEEIILVAGRPPIRAKKIRYYEDRNFTSRLMAAPAQSDRIRLPQITEDDFALAYAVPKSEPAPEQQKEAARACAEPEAEQYSSVLPDSDGTEEKTFRTEII